jgi:hypothetical protein
MLTDSTELKSTGRPLPLEVMRERTPLRNTSADWPRMLALEGAPKFVVVKADEVSFEKSSTLSMEMALSCWREMIVTLRGTSTMLSSVPNTELKGRAMGSTSSSTATPEVTLKRSSSRISPSWAANHQPGWWSGRSAARKDWRGKARPATCGGAGSIS